MRLTHLLVLLLLLLLAVGLTYPLVTQLSTHVPGSDIWAYDEYTFLWNIWWFKQALLDLHTSPLHTDLLFYPVSLDLVMYTFNLMAAALALPVQLATGNVALSSNLVNLASSVMGGYGVFLLVRYLLRRQAARAGRGKRFRRRDALLVRDAAALLAGLVYAFAASRSVYFALGHYMIVTTQWVPFFTLYLVRTLDRWRPRDALLAGLFAGLALLTDMLYGVLLALIALVLLANWWLYWRSWQRDADRVPLQGLQARQILGRLLLIAGVAALISAPLLIPTLQEGVSADYAVEGWGHSDKLSADLAGMVTPTALHPLQSQGWEAELRAVETGQSRFRDVNTVFVGWATLALALLGMVTAGKRSRPWAILAGLAALLALGPLLQINGQMVYDLDGLDVTLPLPYIIMHYLPFIKGFRAPNRFSIVLMLALAVLAGFGLNWMLAQVFGLRERPAKRALFPLADRPSAGRRIGGTLLAGGLIALVIFEHLAVPLPLTDARVPSVYEQIAQEPGDFALMQLPMGWRNGFGVFGPEDTRVEWYSSTHQRPILGGNTSRNPEFKFEYFRRQPLLQAITGIEMHQPPDESIDRQARQTAQELMSLWNVRYLVVNPPVPGRYPYVDTWQAARDYALDVLPVDSEPVWDEDGVQVYAVRQPLLPFPFSLDFGAEETSAYRGPGWSVDEADIAGVSGIWAEGSQAELYLPLRFDQPKPLQLALRVSPFVYPDSPPQALSAELNGVALGTRAVTPGWQELHFEVPAEATVSGLNRLWLRFSQNARPADVTPGQGVIGSTGVVAPLDVEINSGGAAQDFAFMTLSDADQHVVDASAGRRGYNVAVVDAKTGELMAVEGFDTWANEFEAERLAEFVEAVPPGAMVLVAARDDASRFLTDRAVAALASLGSQVDLRASPGFGHALIGVKGAIPGSVAEAVGENGVYLRLASDRRLLSVAVDWLRLEGAP